MSLSPAASLAVRAGPALFKLLAALSDEKLLALLWDHTFWARPEQNAPPGEWDIWLALAGRGWGKTFAGAKWTIEQARSQREPGIIVGATAKDVRDTMILGPSGILALSPPWFRPKYEPSKARLTWPNGRYATCYSADKPDRLRGPNAGWGWGDELTSWAHEMAGLDQMKLVCRIGRRPRIFLSTTPKPFKKLKDLLETAGVVVTRGSTFDNAANLAESTVAGYRAYAQTLRGRQELMGELIFDVGTAIFARAKWARREPLPPEAARGEYERRIVAVDPSPTSDTKSDETGIVVEGVRSIDRGQRVERRVGVLADLTQKGTPREWAGAAIQAYADWDCDTLVVEVNSGGEMVEEVVRTVAAEMFPDRYVNVKSVRATSAKAGRGQPVSAKAELGEIELCGSFERLERQLALFTGVNGRRDDAADAFIWGVHELALGDPFFALY